MLHHPGAEEDTRKGLRGARRPPPNFPFHRIGVFCRHDDPIGCEQIVFFSFTSALFAILPFLTIYGCIKTPPRPMRGPLDPPRIATITPTTKCAPPDYFGLKTYAEGKKK